MKAYDLGFGESAGSLSVHPGRSIEIDLPGARVAGWCGGRAPGIGAASWPRSPVTGLPMIHVITLELPEDYRRKGDDLVAVSFFQADDHVADDIEGVDELLAGTAPTPEQAADPFLAAVAATAAARHPRQQDLEDMIGGAHALIRLTAEEFAAPRIDPPADIRPDGLGDRYSRGQNAWDDSAPETTVWIGERTGDPNTGLAPAEDGEDGEGGYVDAWSSDDEDLEAFWSSVEGVSHLGGTVMPCQGLPDGLTPYVFELEDGVGGVNFGGGNAQIDLESGVFDWAQ
ncbi:hypothetical protein CG717_15665 [Streptomyces sp. CB02613]|uniref:hypothetical protein n=1 Tax=Streptomyces sp. CB02613 TaxID=2020328 RepID=UPI000C2714FF|nr:hypothetical protein [Streptomyces sp. CB02613]PJN31220.1 hypothetical protein CG717_15665 [Streptomyces sp. CB02613]